MPAALVRPLFELAHLAGVLLDWLLTYTLHSTILIGALWLLTSRATGRVLGIAGRSWPWMIALTGGLLTATLQVSGAIPAPAGTVQVGRAAATRALIRVEVKAENPGATLHATPRPFVTRNVRITPQWPMGATLLWITGAAASLGWLAFARRRFFRSIADRESAAHTTAGHALRWVCQRAGVERPIRLTVADHLTSPVAIGGDEICIPRRALAEMDHVQQESMLAHELAHLERRDAWALMAARAIEAVFFFQPLNRLARRRMQDAAELESDAWAVGVVDRPLVLARCLARVAEWTVAAPRLLAPAMAERPDSMLVQRVSRLTSGRLVRSRERTRPALAMAALVLAVVLLVPRPVTGAAPAKGLQSTGERQVQLILRRSDDLRAEVFSRGLARGQIARSSSQAARVIFMGRRP